MFGQRIFISIYSNQNAPVLGESLPIFIFNDLLENCLGVRCFFVFVFVFNLPSFVFYQKITQIWQVLMKPLLNKWLSVDLHGFFSFVPQQQFLSLYHMQGFQHNADQERQCP